MTRRQRANRLAFRCAIGLRVLARTWHALGRLHDYLNQFCLGPFPNRLFDERKSIGYAPFARFLRAFFRRPLHHTDNPSLMRRVVFFASNSVGSKGRIPHREVKSLLVPTGYATFVPSPW